jgi:hypothetical protein
MTAEDPARAATRVDAAGAGAADWTPEPPAPAPQPRLSQAIAGRHGWTLQTPLLARRHHGHAAAYVSACLDHCGSVDHWAWWVETAGLAVAANDVAPDPAGAVAAADTALVRHLAAR